MDCKNCGHCVICRNRVIREQLKKDLKAALKLAESLERWNVVADIANAINVL